MTEQTNNPIKINNRGAFLFLGILVTIGGFFTYLSAFFPNLFSVILNFLWVLAIIIVVIFLVLGGLVVMGLQSEVRKFLDVLLEGSLTILDAVEFLKKLYRRFIQVLKEFIYFITPVVAGIISFFIYIAILVMYKSIGRENDVTLLTTIITIVMVVIVALLNKPTVKQEFETWRAQVKERFRRYFSDSFEVVVFIFFLTMDSTNLFFLPSDLNVELHAEIGQYNLMLKSVDVTSQVSATVFLVTLAILVEIIRNILKIVVYSTKYLHELPKENSTLVNLKEAIRLGFADSKDDLIKFITFTTVLIAVFLMFPRLKLFAMLIASLTSLVLDFTITGRFARKNQEDLFSRLIVKAFKL